MPLNQGDLFSKTATGALFSPCGEYRYTLWRQWDDGPTLLAVLLNPSTADATVNDPTVARVEKRARSLGYSRLVVCNIFAYKATDPFAVKAQNNPVGLDNDWHILEQAGLASKVMVGWGNHGDHLNRGKEVARLLRNAGIAPVCLGSTAGGQPLHPLYVSLSTPLQPWEGGL